MPALRRLLLTSIVTLATAVFLGLSSSSRQHLVMVSFSEDPSMSKSKFADPGVLAEVQKILQVANTPRPATASGKTAWAMAWMHVVVWNAWRSAYFHADKVPQGDFAAYRSYATLAVQFLVDHHDAEEKTLFPMIEDKLGPGEMEKNKEQHEAFLKPLTDILTYIKASEAASDFDPATFRRQMDTLLYPVMQHLAEELDSLAADKLSAKMSEAEIDAVNKATHKAQQGDDSMLALPFVVQNLPPGCTFPPAPGFVKNLLGPWVFYWKYADMWKYTAYPWKQTLSPVPDLK